MIKRTDLPAVFVFFLAVCIAALYPAEASAEPAERIARADELFEKGGLDNYREAVEIYTEIADADPENFEANWKAARALRELGEEHRMQGVEGYEDICEEYGGKGMVYAEKAIELEPERVEGYLYYGMNVSTYSEGVGLLTAIREGLKNKTQSNLEKAYELDPDFNGGMPVYVLGRFWQVVPWPYTDRDKAMALYREFQDTKHFEENVPARIFLAELLDRRRGRAYKEEARELLESVLEMDAHPYWHDKARAMLDDM